MIQIEKFTKDTTIMLIQDEANNKVYKLDRSGCCVDGPYLVLSEVTEEDLMAIRLK